MVYRASKADPWTLIGIVSFGDTICGTGNAGVYTYVEEYMDWIRANIRP